jgi:cardiolipin synthase
MDARTTIFCLGLLLAPMAGSALADDTQPLTFEGNWRFKGETFRGPYRGMMSVTRRPNQGGLVYERQYLNALQVVSNLERGRVLPVGKAAFTQQFITPGLLNSFGLTKNVPQRHGFYRLETPFKASGSSFTAATMERSRESLARISPNAPNNHVQLLVDGAEYYPSFTDAFANAQESIYLQAFIYTDDSTGKRVGRLLSQKARDGLDVRVLVDNVNSKVGKELQREWKSAGVKFVKQHTWGKGIAGSLKNVGRSIWDGIKGLFGGKKKARAKRGIFNHDHRKITIVDGKTAFIGGMNIAREYEHVWHDTHTKIEGDAVEELSEVFYGAWDAAGGKGDRLPTPAFVQSPNYWPGDMQVEVLQTVPGIKTEIYERYLKEIRKAHSTVRIEMAYLLNDKIVNALKSAARRGVETIVIIPNDEDHDVKIVRNAFNWVQNDVVNSGVQLYKYRDRMVHSKVATFDGRLATVGSCNLDDMALTKLYEANVFVTDRGFTRKVDERIFVVDVPKSDRVQVKKLSFWNKVKSGFLRLFKGLL